MQKTVTTERVETLVFDEGEILKLLREAVQERYFLGGQLGTGNDIGLELDTFSQLPSLTVRLRTLTTEDEEE